MVNLGSGYTSVHLNFFLLLSMFENFIVKCWKKLNENERPKANPKLILIVHQIDDVTTQRKELIQVRFEHSTPYTLSGMYSKDKKFQSNLELCLLGIYVDFMISSQSALPS